MSNGSGFAALGWYLGKRWSLEIPAGPDRCRLGAAFRQ